MFNGVVYQLITASVASEGKCQDDNKTDNDRQTRHREDNGDYRRGGPHVVFEQQGLLVKVFKVTEFTGKSRVCDQVGDDITLSVKLHGPFAILHGDDRSLCGLTIDQIVFCGNRHGGRDRVWRGGRCQGEGICGPGFVLCRGCRACQHRGEDESGYFFHMDEYLRVILFVESPGGLSPRSGGLSFG